MVEAKLSDFGEAKVKGLNTTRLRHVTLLSTRGRGDNKGHRGTAAYQAPELLLEEVPETSRVSEMYSSGATVWECLTGEAPHQGKKESSIILLAVTKKNQPVLNIPGMFQIRKSKTRGMR